MVGVIASRFTCSGRGSAGQEGAESLQSQWSGGCAGGGSVPTDDEQVTGLEMEAMKAAWKGLGPFNMLAPKAALDTKEDPKFVPSVPNKQRVGCI